MDFSTIDELYGKDEERNEEGAEVHIGLNRKNEPIKLIVAEAMNPKHKKAIRKYEKALETARRNEKKRRLINAKILAEGILMGWSGVIDKTGKEIPASMENKIQFMMRSEQFMITVIDAAGDHSNFHDETIGDLKEDTEKNSKAS